VINHTTGEPGSYTVKAEPAIEGGVEPKILIGK
jgi:hypothetical protein